MAELAERVVTLVSTLPDDTALHVAAGSMTLIGYLPTRTFELTVHTLDLARAADVTPPDTPAESAACS